MSEHAPNSNTPQNPGTPSSTPAPASTPNAPAAPAASNPPQSPPAGQVTPAQQAAIEKARQEEKDKLYGRMQALAEQSAAQQKKIDELLARQKADDDAKKAAEEAAKKAADEEAKKKRTEIENLRLEMEERDKKAADELKKLRKEQAKMAADQEAARLQLIREREIARLGLSEHSVDLVTGADEEAIKASVEKLKKREDAIRQKAAEDAARELGAEIPTSPLNMGGSGGQGQQPAGAFDANERRRLRNLSPEQWKAERDAALKRAREEAQKQLKARPRG